MPGQWALAGKIHGGPLIRFFLSLFDPVYLIVVGFLMLSGLGRGRSEVIALRSHLTNIPRHSVHCSRDGR